MERGFDFFSPNNIQNDDDDFDLDGNPVQNEAEEIENKWSSPAQRRTHEQDNENDRSNLSVHMQKSAQPMREQVLSDDEPQTRNNMASNENENKSPFYN